MIIRNSGDTILNSGDTILNYNASPKSELCVLCAFVVKMEITRQRRV